MLIIMAKNIYDVCYDFADMNQVPLLMIGLSTS